MLQQTEAGTDTADTDARWRRFLAQAAAVFLCSFVLFVGAMVALFWRPGEYWPIQRVLAEQTRSGGLFRTASIDAVMSPEQQLLVFYGWWEWRLLLLLLVAIAVSWMCAARAIQRGHASWIIIGVVLNLALLGYFKYANFFAGTAASIFSFTPPHWRIVLPLAISFFTFHQISYLIDIARGERRLYAFGDYVLYVVFFPHLIAGPIVRHNEFMPHIAGANRAFPEPDVLARGVG